MKKYISIIPITLIVLSLMFCCKKNESPKDYTASIKDKTWWGQLNYIGQPLEYYSVHFNADHSLLWSQLAGDYPGQWELNGNELNISFSGNTNQIKAEISDDNSMVSISDNVVSSEIINGKLIENPNVTIDNIIFLGSAYIDKSKGIQLSFIPNLKVKINIENSPIETYSYTRSSSGSVLRAVINGGEAFFGVITSGSEMKGSIGKSDSPWQATKQ